MDLMARFLAFLRPSTAKTTFGPPERPIPRSGQVRKKRKEKSSGAPQKKYMSRLIHRAFVLDAELLASDFLGAVSSTSLIEETCSRRLKGQTCLVAINIVVPRYFRQSHLPCTICFNEKYYTTKLHAIPLIMKALEVDRPTSHLARVLRPG
jgi:hypothetical protein